MAPNPIAIVSAASPLRATAQIPDRILIRGKEYSLNTNPLEKYLEANPNKRPQGGLQSTGCWRGYVATWEVVDGQMILRKVEVEEYNRSAKKGEFKTKWINVTQKVFPGASKVIANWYTGTLIILDGEMVNYVHMGYGSTYEKYKLVTVKAGSVKKDLDLSRDEF